MKFRYTCTTAIVLGALASNLANAQEVLETVTVTGTTTPATTPIDPDELSTTRESADMLRDIPGVSGSRMGGHGTDPVIRGLGQTRLNVLLDGAYVHGGCPNRMDPPTAYAPPTSYEDITVIKGVQTLEHGSGGPGGTILFERATPRFSADEQVRANLDMGYRSNGDGWDFAADVAGGNETAYVRFIGSRMKSGNYEDGDGDDVRSAYKETSGTAILGYTPNDDTLLELSVERQETRDLLFAGAGMDSPLADNDTYRLKFKTSDLSGALSSLKAEIYRSEVEHVMDNYTLRTPANPMMLMRAPSSSDTTGGRLVAEVDSSLGEWKLGIDFQDNDRDATRTNDANGMLNSILWPGVSIDQRGVFAELTHELDKVNRVIAGARYDHVSSDASKADVVPNMPPLSPNDLYAIYYNGAQAEKRTEHNWGGLLRLERDLANGLGMVYAGLSRTVRTADATERFLASNGMTPSARWVGNPGIDPEKHRQLELGVQLKRNAWDLSASVYYNDVDDYILRDRFHQVGNNATIYRNVDASLYGGEINVGYLWTANWRSEFGLAYVHADNDTDDRPIAQTPPLEGIASLEYTGGTWDAGMRVRAAAQQTRVDDDVLTGSGLDVDKTPGWAVVDIFGRYEVNDRIDVNFGVDNLFDKEYAQHLNRSSAFDPLQVQVNEPGRSAWVKLSAEF
jgi:iron complex outermembrane receptor protein